MRRRYINYGDTVIVTDYDFNDNDDDDNDDRL